MYESKDGMLVWASIPSTQESSSSSSSSLSLDSCVIASVSNFSSLSISITLPSLPQPFQFTASSFLIEPFTTTLLHCSKKKRRDSESSSLTAKGENEFCFTASYSAYYLPEMKDIGGSLSLQLTYTPKSRSFILEGLPHVPLRRPPGSSSPLSAFSLLFKTLEEGADSHESTNTHDDVDSLTPVGVDSLEYEGRDNVYPVNFAQFRLYYEHNKFPDNPRYNMVEAYVLPEGTNVDVLIWAVKQIVLRQDALRTTFSETKSGEIVQVVQPMELFDFLTVTHDPHYRYQVIDAFLLKENNHKFNLQTGPLFRTIVAHFLDSCVLVFSLHHIISDGYSMGILHKELHTLYLKGVTLTELSPNPFLPPLAVKYHELAALEHKQMKGEESQKMEKWWREYMCDLPPACTIPYDKSSDTPIFDPGLIVFPLESRLAQAIHLFTEREGISHFTTLLTAFHWTIAYMSHRDVTVLGSAFANREVDGSEDVIGFFVNMIPTSLCLNDDTYTFRSTCSQLNSNYLKTRSRQLPFNLIVSAVNPDRVAGGENAPVFQTTFTFQNAFSAPSDGPFHLSRALKCPVKVAYDLEVHYYLDMIQDRHHFDFVYRKELYHHSTIAAAVDLFHYILIECISNPEIQFSRLPLSKGSLLCRMSGLDHKIAPSHEYHSVLQLFYDQVSAHPDRVALVVASTENVTTQHPTTMSQADSYGWTYRVLDRISSTLSQKMLSSSKTLTVAIYMDRSPMFIACMLAVLKSGHTYMAMDPSYPSNYIFNILSASKCDVVLTETKHVSMIIKYQSSVNIHEMRVINVTDHIETLESCLRLDDSSYPIDEYRHVPQGTDLAYILPTSGSTGVPKCCEITHSNLYTSTMSRLLYYHETPPQRYLLTTSLSFDSSVAGLYWTLCVGGTLLLPLPKEEKDVARLSEIIYAQNVTHLLMIPSFLKLLCSEGEDPKERLSSLNVVIVAGEACPWDFPSFFATCCPNSFLFNEYGPTECTVWATVDKLVAYGQVCDGVDEDDVKDVSLFFSEEAAASLRGKHSFYVLGEQVYDGNGPALPDYSDIAPVNNVIRNRVTIGKPIPGYIIVIVDSANKRPLGPYIIGEIYITGGGVCHGYRGMKSDKFLTFEELFGSVTPEEIGLSNLSVSSVWYRTGDLGRWGRNGKIQFLGRCDNMTKINGFRIELEDIETRIMGSHAAIREAAVCVADRQFRQQVYAFLSLKNGDVRFARDDVDRVKNSQLMYEAHYEENRAEFDGWNSSYNMLPYSLTDLQEWATETCGRITSLFRSDDLVVEIGVGSGILLTRIADQCKEYIGSDFSSSAIKSLRNRLDAEFPKISQSTHLHHRLAHEVDFLEKESASVVILNSVIQYFPSSSYLIRVLSEVDKIVSPGGSIFIGDVRHKHAEFDLFHFSVQLFAARDTLSVGQLWETTAHASTLDQELVVSPIFWYSLLKTDQFKNYNVSLELKGTKSRTEMSLFRYDVTMTKKPFASFSEMSHGVTFKQFDYISDLKSDPDTLTEILKDIGEERERRECVVCIDHISNFALWKESTSYLFLSSLTPSQLNTLTVGDLRLKLKGESHARSLDTAAIYSLGAKYGLATRVTHSRTSNGTDVSRSQLSVIRAVFATKSHLLRTESALNIERDYFSPDGIGGDALTNTPYDPVFQSWIETSVQSEVVANLRSSILPNVIPSEYIFLLDLPRLPNGKLNRRALLNSIGHAGTLSRKLTKQAKSVPPADSDEKDMVEMWEQVLNVNGVSVLDSFQDLGGNSLTLTFLRNKISRGWKVNISFGELWELKTPREMVNRIKFLVADGATQ